MPEFDPKAYLAETAESPPEAFDPKAYLADQAPAVEEFDPKAYLGTKEPSLVASIGKGLAQGVIGQAGVSTTGLPTFLEGMRKGGAGGFQQQMMEEQLAALPEDTQAALEAGRKTGYEAIRKKGEEVSKFGQEQFPVPKEHEGLGIDVARGFGSFGANVATGLLGGPVLAGVSALSGGAGEALQGARQKGATEQQQELAAQFGTIPGATDLVDSLLPFMGSSGRLAALIGKVGARVFKGLAAEGIQEGGQQFLQNLIAKGIYDPQRDVWEDVPRSALVGAIVGGGVTGVFGGRGEAKTDTPATPEDIAAAQAGLTQQPTPAAGAAGVQGELPLGPPTNQLGLPLGPPVPIVEPPQVAVAAQRAAAASQSFPSASPDVVRGGPASTLFGQVFDGAPGVASSGPIETNPQPITVARDDIPLSRQTPLAADETVPQQGLQSLSYPSSGVIAGVRGAAIPIESAGVVGLNSLHSTTLGDILPTLPLDHLNDKPVNRGIAKALIDTLRTLIPSMPVHVMLPNDMRRVTEFGAAIYIYSSAEPRPGIILVQNSELRNPKRATWTILHEATHGLTSYTLREDYAVQQRVRRLMEVAEGFAPPDSGITLSYAFTNEREFIAEAFSNEAFQDFLNSHPASRELRIELGLEGRPTMWDALVEMVRNVLRLPKSRDTTTLLEATIRVGANIIDIQARQVAEMQAKFNRVEPGLRATERQDETRGVYDMISGLRDHIGDSVVRDELTRQAGYADKMNKFYQYTIHAFQLGELNPFLVPLQRYLEKIRGAAVEEAGINDAAMRVMKDWENIGREQGERLTGFIDDVTNMVYRTPAEVRRGVGRNPTQQEFGALVKKHGLNAEALDVFRKINTMFSEFLDKSSQLALAEAAKITDPAAKIAAINAITANVTNLKARPYFPFMRYGRHVVLVRNAKGVVVHREHFEGRGFRSAQSFQKQAAEKLKTQFPAPQYTVELDLMSESSVPLIGMPGMMLDLVAQKLTLTKQQLQALEQLRYEVSPAESFQHRFQNKSYTKGYSKDFQRSFAQYFFHGAKWYVKTKYAEPMREDIKAVYDGRNNSLTPEKRLQIWEFMNDHLQNNFLDPAQDFIHLKAGLVFFTLAYVPASAAINLSQVPMVSLPFMTAKFGPLAGLFLSKEVGTAKNYFTKGTIATMTSAEARALDYGIKSGRLEQTLGAELASWAQGGNLGVGYGGSATARGFHNILQKGMWMFSIAEKWNRRVTYMAAYKMAVRSPNNRYGKDVLTRYTHELQDMIKSGIPQHEAEAMLVAGHVVDQTQFMASTESRPRMMRGKWGTVLLYKRYVQGLLFLTANNKKDFAPMFIVMMLFMAGLSGLPGYDDLKEIARALAYRMFGKDFNLDREIRKLVREMTDEKWAPDQVLHGTARTGFGVPWLLNMLGNAVGQKPTVNSQTGAPSGPDLSRSIGFGGPILPIEVGKLFGPPIKEPGELFGEQTARAGGVGGQLAFSMYKAMVSKDSKTDFKRWESLMPRAAKDLSQSYRAYSEEKVRGRNDTAIIRFDTRDPEHLGEILGLAGGFQPRRLTAKWDEIRDQSEAIKFWDTSRSMLLEQWAAAIRAGKQPEEMEKLQTATREFNTGLPDWAKGNALTLRTIKESVEAKIRSQTMQEGGLAVRKKDIPVVREIQSLHPEAVIDVRKVPR